jgi:hypothetical protein
MKQHERTIEKDENPSKSEMVQHHQEKRYQCMFDPAKAFVISNEIDWRKRRLKEAIYSNVNQSINRRDDIDKAWMPILFSSRSTINKTIEVKRRTFEYATVRKQDDDSGSEEI